MAHSDPSLSWNCVPLTRQAIQDIEQAWLDLAAQAEEQNVYLFPWYIEASLELLRDNAPQLVTIYHDKLLIGLFIVESDFGFAKLPLSFYRTSNHLNQFLGTPLVRKDYLQQFANGIFQWIDQCSKIKCFLYFTSFTGDTALFHTIEKMAQDQGRSLAVYNRQSRAAIHSLQQSENQENDHLSASRRKSLRRIQNKLEASDVKIEPLEQEADLSEWLQGFIELEHQGWKGKQGTSIQSSAADLSFYQNMIPQAFGNKALNFFRLTLDGKPIAYTLDFINGPFVYCHKSTYDEQFKTLSPGVYMEYKTLLHYRNNSTPCRVDSCSASDNSLLNELWPDSKSIISLAIGRKGLLFEKQFQLAATLKNRS